MSSRAQELADAATKLPSAERSSFLAQACGADQELLDQAKSFSRQRPVQRTKHSG